MAQFPFVCLQKKLFLFHLDTVTICKRGDNLLEFFFIRFSKINGHAESCYQRKFLLYGIIGVQFFISVGFIFECLTYQMSSVGSCIDQDIIRFLLQTAFDHRFQIFVLNLEFFKRKIIHINNKFVIPVLDLCDHIIQVFELMLVHFDHTKSLVIILVQDCLDRRRFTGSGITKKQTVISFFALYKCLRIIDQFLLGNVIAHQIIQMDVCDLGDRHDLCSFFCMLNTECLVKSESSHSEFLIELGYGCLKFFCIICLRKCFA